MKKIAATGTTEMAEGSPAPVDESKDTPQVEQTKASDRPDDAAEASPRPASESEDNAQIERTKASDRPGGTGEGSPTASVSEDDAQVEKEVAVARTDDAAQGSPAPAGNAEDEAQVEQKLAGPQPNNSAQGSPAPADAPEQGEQDQEPQEMESMAESDPGAPEKREQDQEMGSATPMAESDPGDHADAVGVADAAMAALGRTGPNGKAKTDKKPPLVLADPGQVHSVGDQVMYFSATHKVWIATVVRNIHRNESGAPSVYDLACKSGAEPKYVMRPADNLKNVADYVEGAHVQYRSPTLGTWTEAVVQRKYDKDGIILYDLSCKRGALCDDLRPSPKAFTAGDKLEYWSDSLKQWLKATILKVHAKHHTCDLDIKRSAFLGKLRKVPKNDDPMDGKQTSKKKCQDSEEEQSEDEPQKGKAAPQASSRKSALKPNDAESAAPEKAPAVASQSSGAKAGDEGKRDQSPPGPPSGYVAVKDWAGRTRYVKADSTSRSNSADSQRSRSRRKRRNGSRSRDRRRRQDSRDRGPRRHDSSYSPPARRSRSRSKRRSPRGGPIRFLRRGDSQQPRRGR